MPMVEKVKLYARRAQAWVQDEGCGCLFFVLLLAIFVAFAGRMFVGS